MNNAARLSQIANAAHAAAEKVLAGFAAAGMQITDAVSVARAACVGMDADSREGQLFVDRFVGHVINVQCGTAGR